MLTLSGTLSRIEAALSEMDLDGWLLFDFHGVNPVTVGMIALEGMVTRRIFVYVPRAMPTAITHAIEPPRCSAGRSPGLRRLQRVAGAA